AADRLREALPRPVGDVVLRRAHEQATGLTAAVDALRGRLPLAGAPAPARRPRSSLTGGMVALTAQDPLDEARLIGSALRDLHHREQVEYDQMAVVCRSGAAVADLADLLARTGLPVRVPHRPQPLREVPAIADLLSILEIGSAPADAPLDASCSPPTAPPIPTAGPPASSSSPGRSSRRTCPACPPPKRATAPPPPSTACGR